MFIRDENGNPRDPREFEEFLKVSSILRGVIGLAAVAYGGWMLYASGRDNGNAQAIRKSVEKFEQYETEIDGWRDCVKTLDDKIADLTNKE